MLVKPVGDAPVIEVRWSAHIGRKRMDVKSGDGGDVTYPTYTTPGPSPSSLAPLSF